MNTFDHPPTLGTKLQGKITANEYKDVKEIYLKLVGDLHIRVGEFSRSISLVDDSVGLFNADMMHDPTPLDERINQFHYSFSLSESLPPSFRYRSGEDSVVVEYTLVLCVEYKKLFKKAKKHKFTFDLIKSTSNPIEFDSYKVISNSIQHKNSIAGLNVHVPDTQMIPMNKSLPINLAITLTRNDSFDLKIHFHRLVKLRTRRWHELKRLETVLFTLQKSDMISEHTDYHTSQVTHHFSTDMNLIDISDFAYKDILSISHLISVDYNNNKIIAFDTPLIQISRASSITPPTQPTTELSDAPPSECPPSEPSMDCLDAPPPYSDYPDHPDQVLPQ